MVKKNDKTETEFSNEMEMEMEMEMEIFSFMFMFYALGVIFCVIENESHRDWKLSLILFCLLFLGFEAIWKKKWEGVYVLTKTLWNLEICKDRQNYTNAIIGVVVAILFMCIMHDTNTDLVFEKK